MKVMSKITDEHVTSGNTYVVECELDADHIVVWDDNGELRDLLDDEFSVLEV